MLLLFPALPAHSQSATGSVQGVIVDQVNGLPIAGAAISLFQGDNVVASAKTNAQGVFKLDSVTPGLYTITIAATGYLTSRSQSFAVLANATAGVNLAVSRATQQQETGQLRTIGTVSASTTGSLASTTNITNTVDPVLVQKENYIGFGLALARLPGVNSTGLSSSVSDDQSLDIRGLGSSETATLLDGHPVGPQGVYPANGGGSFPSSFNFADSPIFGLSKVTVTFGSGATGLYGVDAIGGTIDIQTMNPTLKPTANFWQAVGDQGRLQTAFDATGTAGRFSYAVAAGTEGTYGMFPPGLVTQTGRPNNNQNANHGGACLGTTDPVTGNFIPDVSLCNTMLNTYSVSQNSVIKAGLAKLAYNLSPNTKFTTTLYSSGQQSDSTGNGDNDNIPYDTRLAQIQQNPGDCALPGGSSTSGYLVTTAPNVNSCYSAQQYAQASYGPYGGGADRNRGTTMSDYNFNLQSVSGKNTIIADGYYNYYKYYKSSEEASGLDPTGTMYTGTQFSQWVNTQGYLLADDFQNENSDFGLGYFGQYQHDSRLDYNVAGQGLYSWENPESTHYNSGFLKGSMQFNNMISGYANLWVKSDSVIGDTNFDPRLSLVIRPDSNDVFRLTYGHSTGDPAAELKFAGAPQINGNPSSLNPSCTPYNDIGSAGNPNIKAEAANDYEIGYAHRFQGDSSIGVNAYYTYVGNQIFSASEPLTQYGAVPISETLLAGYAAKIGSVCPGVNPAVPSSVIPFLSISTAYNALSAVSKGIELTGRQRLSRHWYFDYSYNLQSVTQNGVNENILSNNPFIINGGQVEGVPLNQGTAGVDYANGGLEARMDGYVVGNNNPSSRPGYNTWNGFVSYAMPRGLTFNLGVQNMFNQASQMYGYLGHAPLIPENHYFNDTTSIQQYLSTGSNEQFGLATRSFLFTANFHI